MLLPSDEEEETNINQFFFGAPYFTHVSDSLDSLVSFNHDVSAKQRKRRFFVFVFGKENPIFLNFIRRFSFLD